MIADAIRDQFVPACYSECAADGDPNTTIVDPICTLELELPDSDPVDVPECLRNDAGGYVVDPSSGRLAMPNDEVDACFGLRVDTDMSTVDLRDDISQYCTDYGYNLEFDLVYRPGLPPSPGRRVTATCELASEPQVDCPGLGS